MTLEKIERLSTSPLTYSREGSRQSIDQGSSPWLVGPDSAATPGNNFLSSGKTFSSSSSIIKKTVLVLIIAAFLSQLNLYSLIPPLFGPVNFHSTIAAILIFVLLKKTFYAVSGFSFIDWLYLIRVKRDFRTGDLAAKAELIGFYLVDIKKQGYSTDLLDGYLERIAANTRNPEAVIRIIRPIIGNPEVNLLYKYYILGKEEHSPIDTDLPQGAPYNKGVWNESGERSYYLYDYSAMFTVDGKPVHFYKRSPIVNISYSKIELKPCDWLRLAGICALPEIIPAEELNRLIGLDKKMYSASSPVEEGNSEEYRLMSNKFREILSVFQSGKTKEQHVFVTIREASHRILGIKFDGDRADEAVLRIKEELIPHLLNEAYGMDNIRQRLQDLLLNQAGHYFNVVDGFGSVEVDIDRDDKESLRKKEIMHEDIFFASMQAIAALQILGEAQSLHELTRLAISGLRAHQHSVNLQKMVDEVERERKVNAAYAEKLNLRVISYYEAVRRWTAMEILLIKVIAGMGNNRLLIDVLLNYQATGEGHYWLRQQAAYRLKDFDTKETIKALTAVCDKNSPESRIPPDSIYITLNLEAANKDAISISLQAAMSLIHIYRIRAFKSIKENAEQFCAEQSFAEKEFRFARILGILDAIVSPEVDEAGRIAVLRAVKKVRDPEFILAANVLLDALEEIIGSGQREIFDNEAKVSLITGTVRNEAFEVFINIAQIVGNELAKSGNTGLAAVFNKEWENLKRNSRDINAFLELIGKAHIVLGNLHRLKQLGTFKEGKAYLDLSRKIILESGGGASVGMAGVIARMTTDTALAIIGGTDNGGSTLITRGFDASAMHIQSAATGDHQRFMIEAAIIEGAPCGQIIKSLLNHRFGKGTRTLTEELNSLYKNSRKNAVQEGTEDVFEEFFKKVLIYAKEADKAKLSCDWNGVKNLIAEGVMLYTRGHGEEFMNPDGIYAGLIEFHNLVGAKGLAVLDHPFGNEMIVKLRDGQELIGQSFYSHTPHGPQNAGERKAYRMCDIDIYYPAVPLHSRVNGVIKEAKLIMSGLCSWATSLGILLKNRDLVKAMVKNATAAKILLTNPVKDDETRGLSWRESTVEFTEAMSGYPLELIWNRVLANSNAGIEERLLFPARPQLGTESWAYRGEFGGYAGENTPGEEDLKNLEQRGIRVDAGRQMMRVSLTPQRQNPDLYNSVINAVPELLASAIWELLEERTRQCLETPLVFRIIAEHKEIERLLSKIGLSWASFGMRGPLELIFRDDLASELDSWLNNGEVSLWANDKQPGETWFQYALRTAIKNVTGRDIDTFGLSAGDALGIGYRIKSMPVRMRILSPPETDEEFIANRKRAAFQKDKMVGRLEREYAQRLGIIRPGAGVIDILMPHEIIAAGLTPSERMKHLEAVLRFQLAKAERLAEHNFQNEFEIHVQLLSEINRNPGQKEFLGMLGELSVAVPLMRFLRQAIVINKEPVIMKDMDGTLTAAGTPKNQWMAYVAWVFHNSKILREVITGQAFEGPYKQMVEPYQQVERMLSWASIRTGIPRLLEDEGDIFRRALIGAASGNAVFIYDGTTHGYVKVFQNSMSISDAKLIELAGRLSMPEVGYEVCGHVVELR